MNYHPYFRGKQYELICLRENAELVSKENFTPIIEPVREQGASLKRALDSLKSAYANFLVVANPSVGHHSDNLGKEVRNIVKEALNGYNKGNWIYQIRAEDDLLALLAWYKTNPTIALFHDGYSSGGFLASKLKEIDANPTHHIFTNGCSKPYRKHFNAPQRILIGEGFKKRNNRDYPETELFSDLNVTFQDENMTGFGDYLIVGNEYSETGGPAYAIAIHITYVDPDNDGSIYVRHFISDRVDTPTDPAGKFREALQKLSNECNRHGTKIKRTKAIDEFLKLHEMRHFPGLGYVKKLSMQHHLELLSEN